MSKATLAFGGVLALAIGIPAATFIHSAFTRAVAVTAPTLPEEHERLVDVYVGSACAGGGMYVASSWSELQEQGCRDTWFQQLTEEQVRAMLP